MSQAPATKIIWRISAKSTIIIMVTRNFPNDLNFLDNNGKKNANGINATMFPKIITHYNKQLSYVNALRISNVEYAKIMLE